MAKVTAAIKNRFPTSWLPKWESVFKVPYWVRLGQRVFPPSRCSGFHLSLLRERGTGQLGIIFLAFG